MERNEETRPGLCLSFPGRNWSLELHKQQITLGCSPFADVYLGDFCEKAEIARTFVCFAYADNRWTVRALPGFDGALLNGTPLGQTPCPVREGDRLRLGSREEMTVRRVILCPDQSLEHNATLFFESVHLRDGHLGSEITFDAKKRLLTYRRWGSAGGRDVGAGEENLFVPPLITSRQALLRFISHMKPDWPIQPPQLWEEDQLLLFDGENQVFFDGRTRMAIYSTRWESFGWKTVDTYACRIKTDKESLRAELQYRKPQWPRTEHDLLEDFTVVERKWRGYILYHGGSLIRFGYATSADTTPSPLETVDVPHTVTDRRGVCDYASARWPDMFS